MSSNLSWEVAVRDKVLKEIENFPEKDRMRIFQVIEALPLNPFSGDIEKMKGEENVWRRRIGAYRIFYELLPAERVIYVFHAERRTSKTY